MDPLSLLLAAVVAGATAGIQEQAAQVVKDAYAALKRLLVDKHHVDIDRLERDPASHAYQSSLKEELGDSGAPDDPEVLEAAEQLAERVRQHEPGVAKAVGVDLDDVVAGFVRIRNVKVSGPGIGVDVDRVSAPGGFVIEGVDVDTGDLSDHP